MMSNFNLQQWSRQKSGRTESGQADMGKAARVPWIDSQQYNIHNFFAGCTVVYQAHDESWT